MWTDHGALKMLTCALGLGSGLLLSGCVAHRSASLARPSQALAATVETPLGARAAAQSSQRPRLSGFLVLDANLDAFRARVELADAARKTLDVQSYILSGDRTGRLLAERILQAADRGVRVRILVDDVHLVWRDSWITFLDGHPNIELRIFNPFLGTRAFPGLVLYDFLHSGRLTRRMHNKLFAADNAVAIVGGRNIGDEYFAGRVDRNFEDLDVMVMGPAVRELSNSFDEYWNNEWAYPAAEWRSAAEQARDLRRARETLEARRGKDEASFFGEAATQSDLLARFLKGDLAADWGPARVVFDRAFKVDGGVGGDPGVRVIPEAWALVEEVQNELIVISPYFVPGEEGAALFRRLRQRGVRIRILTNSLGSTDAAIAQTGYERYRSRLLQDGVELYELKPSAMSRPVDRRWFRRHATRPQASLHAKAFVFDRKTVFVGSMNLDHRAHHLNTELALIVENPALAQKIAGLFEESILPQNSYRMALERFERVTSPKLAESAVSLWPVWITEKGGRPVRYTLEPDVSICRRLMASFLMLLPLESQL